MQSPRSPSGARRSTRSRTAGRPKGLAPARQLASTIITLIREEGQFVRTVKKIEDLPDPDDAPFCECAESGNADFIVTLNPSDFPQKRLKARVIAPTDSLPPRAVRDLDAAVS
jgi:PIN domain